MLRRKNNHRQSSQNIEVVHLTARDDSGRRIEYAYGFDGVLKLYDEAAKEASIIDRRGSYEKPAYRDLVTPLDLPLSGLVYSQGGSALLPNIHSPTTGAVEHIHRNGLEVGIVLGNRTQKDEDFSRAVRLGYVILGGAKISNYRHYDTPVERQVVEVILDTSNVDRRATQVISHAAALTASEVMEFGDDTLLFTPIMSNGIEHYDRRRPASGVIGAPVIEGSRISGSLKVLADIRSELT